MAVPASPTNDDGQNVDGLTVSTSLTSIWHRAIDGSAITPTGSSEQAGAEMVGTHIPGEVLASTDPLVLIAGSQGGTVYPLEAGTASSGTALVLHTREVGTNTSRVNHAINVGTAATSLGTGISSGRKFVDIYNSGTVTVFLGPSTVGTATGLPIGTGAYYYEQGALAIYGIVASGTGTLRVQERS